MPTIGFRFDHDQPSRGEVVHCWRSFEAMRGFISMMRSQDSEASRMKFWRVEGRFMGHDEDDILIQVDKTAEIRVSTTTN